MIPKTNLLVGILPFVNKARENTEAAYKHEHERYPRALTHLVLDQRLRCAEAMRTFGFELKLK